MRKTPFVRARKELHVQTKNPRHLRDEDSLSQCSPDGIRTRATALRGRRARPLHNGAMACLRLAAFSSEENSNRSCRFPEITRRARDRDRHSAPVICAGVPGLEPRTNEPESSVLPITPYPKGVSANARPGLVGLGLRSPNRVKTLPNVGPGAKSAPGAAPPLRPDPSRGGAGAGYGNVRAWRAEP